MGETSVYYVPVSDSHLLGAGDELLERFWDQGLFLVTTDNRIYDRIRQWREQGRQLPPCKHSFRFASMGLVESLLSDPVPNMPYEVRCPHCAGSLFEVVMDVWQREDDHQPLPDRLVTCPTCGLQTLSRDLPTADVAFEFARVYFWVSDIDDDFDPSFRTTVESILGPCREYTSWET